MKKHAYLIIAHKDDLTFRTLVNLLDDEKNDLFIHMDKKLEDYDSQTVGDRVSQSNVFHVERTDVAWGGYSQINADLASYVVGQEAFIEETFQHTRCADEMYMHTLIHNSPFKETLYRTTYDGHPDGLMRLIDWDRGQPYTFRRTDFEELTSSPYPFARKFNAKVDSEIILELKAHLS